MPARRKVSDAEIAEALRAAGTLSGAAKLLNIRLWALQKRLKRNPELAELAEGARTELARLARNRLWDLLEAGDPGAIRYVLDRLGYLVGFGPPPVQLPLAPGADPADVLTRLDALESQLAADGPVPLDVAMQLLKQRLRAVSGLPVLSAIEPAIEAAMSDVVSVIEHAVSDADKRRELALALDAAAHRVLGQEFT